MIQCYPVYIASLPECPEEIKVLAHLTPSTLYTWTIVDRRFDTVYIGTVMSDADGAITIATDGVPFPAGIFNRHAGAFELSIKADALQCDPTPLSICIDSLTQESYSTIQFTFHESFSEDPVEAIIGCDCELVETPEGPPPIVLPPGPPRP